MLFAIFLFGDELVLVGFNLPLSRVAHRRGAALVGAQREPREQPLEIVALTRRTFHRRILRSRQRLEFVAAGAAAKVIYRHGSLIISISKRAGQQRSNVLGSCACNVLGGCAPATCWAAAPATCWAAAPATC